MAEMNLNQVEFLSLFGLRPTNRNPEEETPTNLEKTRSPSPTPTERANLTEKNKNTETGYENFCIRKGDLKLLPIKDFDFIGKKVVCQKCFQTFASRRSYRAHVNTNVCVRHNNGKNLAYLKYKNKYGKKKGRKCVSTVEDVNANPEKLNVLETRNRRYTHTVQQSKAAKRKRVDRFDKSDEPVAKRAKATEEKSSDVEPKRRRGRPKKVISKSQSKSATTVSADTLPDSLNTISEVNEAADKKQE